LRVRRPGVSHGAWNVHLLHLLLVLLVLLPLLLVLALCLNFHGDERIHES
jgi:hypothetical protein